MSERDSSTTALRVAQLRAAHQLVDGEPKILHDPAILRLLGNDAVQEIRSKSSTLSAPWVLGLRSHVLLRSRFAEDRLAEAVQQRGVRQYLLLGAGFDTFAYRQPDWSRGLRIFEVDHSATQAAKTERLQSSGIAIPPNVELVPIDFEQVSLREGLKGSRLDFEQPTFVSCLGVLVYLTEEAADAVFRLVASFPKSSEIVFTFSVPPSALAPEEAAGRAALAALADSAGEPWRTHFDPDSLREKLKDLGLEVSFLSIAEAEARYFQGRTDGLRPPRREYIASAVRTSHPLRC